jgi:DNA/RNA-binding domain of Phe-tRNA-synthetase-like protein
VDLCNSLSIAFALPLAVFDLDKIDQYIEVCHADGGEAYLAFNDEIERPSPGEVIFRDGSGHAHARRWTFRQSKLSTVHAETTRALIICEGLHEEAPEQVPALVGTLSQEVSALGTSLTPQKVLTAEDPRFEF